MKEFIQINDELKQAYQAGEIDRCISLNFNFHSFYVKGAANQALRQAIRPMIQRIVRLWVSTLYARKADFFVTTIQEHEKIISAFKRGDAAQVEQMAREHIENLLSRAMRFSVFDKQGNFNLIK